MLTIPNPTDFLYLPISRLWDGTPSRDSRLFALVKLQAAEDGVAVEVEMPELPGAHNPTSPVKTREADLAAFDHVEIFFLDEENQYCLLMIGPRGHYLLQGFDGVQNKVADFESFAPEVVLANLENSASHVRLVIHKEMFPEHLKALNAFLVAGSQRLAYHPLTADTADFHRLELFPFAKIAS